MWGRSNLDQLSMSIQCCGMKTGKVSHQIHTTERFEGSGYLITRDIPFPYQPFQYVDQTLSIVAII